MKWGLHGWQHEYLRQRIEKVESKHGWKQNALYPYFEGDGGFSYVKVRFIDKQNDKTFRQYALSSNGGWVARNRAGKHPILYNLNTLGAADEIFIANGEKAANRGATDLGIVTTCSPDGEGKWCGDYTRPLVGKHVRIVVDRDEKGEAHGKLVSEALAGHTAELKIIRLPGLPPKGDLWDWIEAGGTRDKLRAIVDAAPAFAPLPISERPAISDGPRNPPAQRPKAAGPDLLVQLLNDTGNGDRLIAMHGQDLRYCPAFRKWLLWDGRRWAIDDGGAARRMAKRTMLEYLRQALDASDRDHEKFAYESLESRRISNLLTMAECELVVTPDQLDTSPFLFNFRNGTLDLETAVMRPHLREEFVTKLVHYDYNPEAKCPVFMTFLARIMSNHVDASEPELDRAERMVKYIQRAFGYSLTGTTEEGQRLAQGKLKRITQGMGKIKAVRKYENPIEFQETHKLWMDTNSKPIIRATEDRATFNRLHPIPFTITIGDKEIDNALPRKLLAEAEGILAWAVEGTREWRRIGLDRPPEVAAANDDWKTENDQLGRFVAECCVTSDSFSTKARPLYECYREWAEGAGESPISETLFGKRLKDRGFLKEHKRCGTVYNGIALRLDHSGSAEKV